LSYKVGIFERVIRIYRLEATAKKRKTLIQ